MAACTVKMVPADSNKSSKSSSTKGSGGSSDMGKMFSLMNKSLKTFGKAAMSQVAKEYETISDDSSIGAQSCAQVISTKSEDCGYAFVIGTLTLRNQILLDNQSLVHEFCNPNFVSGIRSAGTQLQLKRNGGKLAFYNVAVCRRR